MHSCTEAARKRAHYVDNRDSVLARMHAQREAKKAEYRERERVAREAAKVRIAALKDHPCVDCGVKFPPCAMDFDHVRGTKKFEIRARTVRRKDLAEELAKCELRCACCHRIRHQAEHT